MTNKILIIPILVSFFVTLFVVPYWMKRAKQAGLVGKDIHKADKKEIPEAGGVAVTTGFVLGALIYIAITTFIFHSTENLIEMFALLSTIILIAFIAFTDDILGWKIGLRRRTRLILVAFASIPLIAINAGRSVIDIPILGVIDLGILYPLILIPIGIVGATATFNFMEGYNGLGTGNGIIVLSAMALVAYFTNNSWLSVVAFLMVCSLLAFLSYNFYPAKVFGGDSLTYPIGGMMAIIAILGNFEKIAVFFFIPYVLEVFLKIRGKLKKQSYSKLKEDGSLELAYDKIYGLEHFAVYAMQKFGVRATEKKVVLCLWAFQIIIVLLGFLIFRGGIFSGA